MTDRRRASAGIALVIACASTQADRWRHQIAGDAEHATLSGRAERRAGVNDLVREVATAWLAQESGLDMKSMLLSRVRQLVAAKTVQLNELPSPLRRPAVRSRDYVACSIPAADAAQAGARSVVCQ